VWMLSPAATGTTVPPPGSRLKLHADLCISMRLTPVVQRSNA